MSDRTKMTIKKKKELFLEMFKKSGGNISESCKKINISRETFYRWCRTNKKFKKQVEELKESLIDFAESVLMKKIKDGDTTSIIFFLKTKGKSRGYVEKQEIEHSGSIEEKIHIYLPKKDNNIEKF